MTRKEAIARIKNHKIVHRMNEPRAIYISEALDMAIKALEQTKWIPCSERLPKIAGVYIVTRCYLNDVMNPTYIVDACCFDGCHTWYDDNRINHARAYPDNIIAWQENPEPYRTEGEEICK